MSGPLRNWKRAKYCINRLTLDLGAECQGIVEFLACQPTSINAKGHSICLMLPFLSDYFLSGYHTFVSTLYGVSLIRGTKHVIRGTMLTLTDPGY